MGGTQMKKFDESLYLADMYNDDYFPNFFELCN